MRKIYTIVGLAGTLVPLFLLVIGAFFVLTVNRVMGFFIFFLGIVILSVYFFLLLKFFK